MNTIQTLRLSAIGILAAAAMVISSCGGGGGPKPGPDPDNKPAAGKADLSGKIVQGSGARAASAVGDGLGGIVIELINTLTGGLAGTDTTDANGNYEIKGVLAGDHYMVKVEFSSAQDLDGDGQLDQVEMYFPVALEDQAIAELIQQIGLVDTNGDGVGDSFKVETGFSDDKGNDDSSSNQVNLETGQSFEDSDGDGSFDDESAFEDSNGDCLPDDSNHDGSPDMSGGSVGSVEVEGLIEAISGTTITVGGLTFDLTAATEYHVGANHNASPGDFAVGQFAEVEGFSSGAGNFIAMEVKDAASDNSDDDGVDSGDDDDVDADEDGIDDGLDSDDDNDGSDDSADSDDDGDGTDDGAETDDDNDGVDDSIDSDDDGDGIDDESDSDGDGDGIDDDCENDDDGDGLDDGDDSDDDGDGIDDDTDDDDNSGGDDGTSDQGQGDN
jgi:Domain of unknown function (DUF5666)